MRRAAAWVLILCIATSAKGQEELRATPGGLTSLNIIVHYCIERGGFKEDKVQMGQKEGIVLRVADRRQIIGVLERARGVLSDELTETAAAHASRRDPATYEALLALLEALGEVRNDNVARGFGAFLTADDKANAGQLDSAAEGFARAASHFAKGKSLYLQAASLNNQASVLTAKGKFSEAESLRRKALSAFRTLYPANTYKYGHPALALAINNFAATLLEFGKYQEAESLMHEALAMRRSFVLALTALGTRAVGSGASPTGLPPLTAVAEVISGRTYSYRPVGHDIATSLNDLGTLYDHVGRFDEAIDYFLASLDAEKADEEASDSSTKRMSGRPGTLVNLAGTLNRIGRFRDAEAVVREAISLDERVRPKQHPNRALFFGFARSMLGGALAGQGRLDEAIEQNEDAFGQLRAAYSEIHPRCALCLHNIGVSKLIQGKMEEAEQSFRRAVTILDQLYPSDRYPTGMPYLAFALTNLGRTLASQGKVAEALKTFERAAFSCRATMQEVPLDGGPSQARNLTPSMETLSLLRNRAEALTRQISPTSTAAELRRCEQAYALAAALHERLRVEVLQRPDDKIQSGEQADELLPAHLGLLARLFETEGRSQDLQTAFLAIEHERARVFIESLGSVQAAAFGGLPADLRCKEVGLSLRLRELEARIESLRNRKGKETALQLRQLYAERLKLEEEQRRFLDQLRVSQPRYANYRFPQACALNDARSCLEDSEIALLYSLGEEVSHVLLVQKRWPVTDKGEGVAIVALPKRAELEKRIEALAHPETMARPADARKRGAELYTMLLGPVADHIKDKDLVIVPDGALSALPFEVLVEAQTAERDGSWLIEKHGIRYGPSLSALHLSRQTLSAKKEKPAQLLWALADPIFSEKDDRLKARPSWPPKDTLPPFGIAGPGRPRGNGFERLEQSGREVEAICRILEVPMERTLRGLQASEATVKAASARRELSNARFVHFATHGVLGEGPAFNKSALVLNQVGNDGKEELGGPNDGFLRLPEVTFLTLNADVVVLSACSTALGRLDYGEGISGLARAFLYAGSKGVVCSLWNVDDAGTADFMAAFYQSLREGQPTTKALQQAKRVMLSRGHAPFLWAPFVLIGE